MAILSIGNPFGATDTVTSTKLNNIANAATFDDPVDDSTLELYDGKLRIKDGGITLQKLTTALKDALYPVGSIYTNATNATNPATLIGFGTWVAFGAGRVLIGEGSDSDDQPTPETVSFTAGDEGGEYNHTLTSSQSGVPAHAHKFRITGDSTPDSGTTGGIMVSGTGSTVNGVSGTPTDTAGQQIGGNTASDAASAHNNLQPYIVVYMWKRTA